MHISLGLASVFTTVTILLVWFSQSDAYLVAETVPANLLAKVNITTAGMNFEFLNSKAPTTKHFIFAWLVVK